MNQIHPHNLMDVPPDVFIGMIEMGMLEVTEVVEVGEGGAQPIGGILHAPHSGFYLRTFAPHFNGDSERFVAIEPIQNCLN